MKHLFIINPAAGSCDRTEEYSAKIRKACERISVSCRIAVSAAPGDCFRIAREAAESGEEYRIYACGGDGTLNEVAAGAAGYENAAVTVFSGGSGNDFVKIFDDPKAFFDIERLLEPEETRFDMIDCNGHLALNIVSVGLDARIGTDVSNYKRIPLLSGFRAYAVSVLINVFRGISEHYVIDICGETIDGEKTLVCACNGRFYGGGFNPVPEADPTDGMLDVLVVEKVGLLKIAQVIGKFKDGKYADYPHLIRHFRTDKLCIRCDGETVINLDGEEGRGQTIHINLSDKKVRFFYPKGLSYGGGKALCQP